MPATYTIDDPARLVRSRAWGILTYDDLLRQQQDLLADPRFDPDYSQLLDYRDIEQVQVTSDDMRRLAQVHVFGAGARRAVVHAPDRLVVRGLAHMYEAYRELAGGRERIGIFDDLDAAMRWLEHERAAR